MGYGIVSAAELNKIGDKMSDAINTTQPSPSTVRASRLSLGLTQSQAGALVGVTDRAWRYWERGERVMPSSAWELFLLKTKK